MNGEHTLYGVDPQFTDPDNGDFTLQSDSPAIGFADSALVAWIVTTDINDSTRTWTDGDSDAGAYLYSGEAPEAPGQVTSVAVTDSSTTDVALSWDAMADVSSFRVKRVIDDEILAIFSGTDSTGTVTGFAPGDTTTVVLFAVNPGGNGTDSAPILLTTEAQVVTSITVSPATASVQVGGNFTFGATVEDQDGGDIEGESGEWTVEDSEIGEIDEAGEFTALKSGITEVYYTIGDVVGVATVTAYAPSAQRSMRWLKRGDWNGEAIIQKWNGEGSW